MTWKSLIRGILSSRRDWLVLLWLTALVAAAADVALPWLLREGIDSALGTPDHWSLDTVALLMMGAVATITLCHMLGTFLETLFFSNATYQLRREIYTHIFHQGRGFFERHRTGELVHRVNGDVQMLEAGLMELFSEMPFSVMSALGILIMMFLTDTQLTGIVLIFLIVATALAECTGRRVPSLRRLIQQRCARLAARFQESVAGIRTVQAFNATERELDRLEEHNERVRVADRYQGIQRAISTPMWELADLIGLVVVLWYAGSRVAAGEISVGMFVAFLSYMEMLAGPIGKVGHYYYQYQSSRGIAQRVASLLEDGDPIPSGEEPGPRDGRRLDFDRVTFTYNEAATPALNAVVLSLEPGQCVAIVGRNGAGKTTLLDLLLRFRIPQSGRIAAGGLDLTRWKLTDWRDRIGWMPQEIVLFPGTMGENVAFGRGEVSEDAIRTALVRAGGRRFLDKFPNGLNTRIGERGATLSGGERQIVALARVLLRDPQIVLLDEPTANLDGDMLRHVGQVLTEFTAGRTTVIVSHDRETVRLASRVVVLDHGRVVAEGTHDQLRQNHELYRQLIGESEGFEKREHAFAAG